VLLRPRCQNSKLPGRPQSSSWSRSTALTALHCNVLSFGPICNTELHYSLHAREYCCDSAFRYLEQAGTSLLSLRSVTAVQPSREQTAAMQVVIVQSTAHGAPHLERRIEAFWRTWQQELEAMSDEEFAKQVANHGSAHQGHILCTIEPKMVHEQVLTTVIRGPQCCELRLLVHRWRSW